MRKRLGLRNRTNNITNPLSPKTIKESLTGKVFGNRIIILAKEGKRITMAEVTAIVTDILGAKGITKGRLSKYYEIIVTMKPNTILTRKGILVRQGKGKGKFYTKVLKLTPGKICVTLISKNNDSKIRELRTIKALVNKYTYLTFKKI